MSEATIGRWGTNLAIRFPTDIAQAVGLADGETVEIIAREHEVIIRKIVHVETIEDLFRGREPARWRELYGEAYDWGPDRGREFVGE